MSDINREAWSRVCIRTKDGSGVDLDATVNALRKYIELQKVDQAAMATAIEEVFRSCSKHEFITTPNVLKVAVMKLTDDFSLWADLEERGKEVLKGSYTTEKKHGVKNPFYTAPAPAA